MLVGSPHKLLVIVEEAGNGLGQESLAQYRHSRLETRTVVVEKRLSRKASRSS